jgi:hypothetical protein
MQRVTASVWAIACVATLATIGCKGDTGPTGPAGAPGTNGTNGNANVVTGTFTLQDSAYVGGFWTENIGSGTILGLEAKIATVPVPAVTDSIADSGAVLVYIGNPVQFNADSVQWAPLPYTYVPLSTGYLVRFDDAFETGVIRIAYMFQPTDAATIPPNVVSSTVPTEVFKYVVIAGTTSAALSAAHVNLANYNQVIAALRSRGYRVR